MVLVSVVLPTDGEPRHLDEAVESVARQDHDALEVVVVHSGDPAAFPAHVRDRPAVRYVNQERKGVAAARNRGIDAASGDVIGFCDADDRWHPAKLARQLPVLRDGADVVYSDEYLVRDGGTYRIESLPVRDPETHHVAFFRNGGGVGSRSVLARAPCFEREQFDERLTVREDPHLWTRLFAAFRPARVPEPLSYKRAERNTLSSDVDRAFRMERLEVEDLCERFPELRPYRAERQRAMRYRYAKRLLAEEGRAGDARRVLYSLVADGALDGRTAALLALSALPAGSRTATRRVQDCFWRLRALRRRFDRDGGAGPRPPTGRGEPAD